MVMPAQFHDPVAVVPLEITRGAVRNFLLVVEESVLDPLTLKTTKKRSDLTGATVLMTVRDKNTGQILITKTTQPTQVEILPQTSGGNDLPTKGQATIKFVNADTETLSPSCCCEYDVWVTLADGRKDAVIDTSPFCIIERVAVTV